MNESEELRALLLEHHASAWGWALSCCDGDRVMAEDILNSSYLKILEGKATFQGRSSFTTWLFSVIRKTAFSYKTTMFRRLELLGHLWRPSASEGETEFNYHRTEMRKKMTEMLQGLSRRQREVLQLVFYHEMTIEESAGVMGVSVGSARKHYERGKERLRRKILETGLRDEYRD